MALSSGQLKVLGYKTIYSAEPGDKGREKEGE